ncbi:hypothetical protein GMOD_00008303 [Pyrenophora seminiperda CCB06]|uniref:RING-type domain-containing protein n=1 Tax=Pyrenophora seminiperda CCB06 TaxID=1302712 RepID=A0A3M7M274_9PLEO|nr:hypothetical protein GMOD_00008303 [Pyrenophora seminiperda CCB06]
MPSIFYTHAALEKFFANSVENLSANYYSAHECECSICGSDEVADIPPAQITSEASTISPTAVVGTSLCPSPHVFHKRCLFTWLCMNLFENKDASCPMCRTKLVFSKTTSTALKRAMADLAEIELVMLVMARTCEQAEPHISRQPRLGYLYACCKGELVKFEQAKTQLEEYISGLLKTD